MCEHLCTSVVHTLTLAVLPGSPPPTVHPFLGCGSPGHYTAQLVRGLISHRSLSIILMATVSLGWLWWCLQLLIITPMGWGPTVRTWLWQQEQIPPQEDRDKLHTCAFLGTRIWRWGSPTRREDLQFGFLQQVLGSEVRPQGREWMPQEARDGLQGRCKSLGEGVEWSPGTQWGKGSYCFLFLYLLNFVLSACWYVFIQIN